VTVFFEEVASQTGILQQHLMYLGHELPLEGSMKVVNLPKTSASRPLILLSYAPEANISLPFRERETKQKACPSTQTVNFELCFSFFPLSVLVSGIFQCHSDRLFINPDIIY